MPQSGERIRGRENMRAFQEAYPDPSTIQPRRVVGYGVGSSSSLEAST